MMTSASRALPASRTIAAADLGIAALALFACVRGTLAWPNSAAELLAMRFSLGQVLHVFALAVVTGGVFRAAGLYDARLHNRGAEMGRTLFAAAAVAAVAIWGAPGAVPLDRAAIFTVWASTAAGLVVVRVVRAGITRSAARSRRVLIVGSGPHAVRICRELSSDRATAYRVLGFIDTVHDEPIARSLFVRRRTFGTLDELEPILAREHVDEVHVGLPIRSRYLEIQRTIRICERVGVKLIYRADVFDTMLARPQVDGTSQRVALRVATEGSPAAIKRAMDLAGATTLLVVLSPLMAATAVAIALSSQGPIIFEQERYGLNRRRFRMLKFRTMVQHADRLQVQLEPQNEARGPIFKIARDPRVTPLGRLLRRTSIDELPQLFNVIKGEMSLIGPRPLPLRDVARFTRTSDMRRFSVRPGMTGLWQVSGRSTLDFDNWIRLDLHYIDRWSLGLDFSILARTIPAVVRGAGAA